MGQPPPHDPYLPAPTTPTQPLPTAPHPELARPSGQSWRQMMSFQPQVPVADNATHRPLIRRIIVWSAVISAFGLAALLMTVIVTESVGASAGLLAFVVSLLAVGVVVPVFLWVDRLEAEPARLLWFAFLWGALISTLGAVILNELGVAFFAGFHPSPLFVGAVIVAPLTEELLKGLGVALIFWRARHEFDGVTDGIVYAGLIAAGFAFVENILYLGDAFLQAGTPGLVMLFIMRCLVSPFAHPMFTVCIGLAFGIAAHRRRLSSIWIVLLGYAAAVFLHSLWNYSAVAAGEALFIVYVLVQVPLFIGFLLLLRWARVRESRILRDTLSGYGINGWFSPAEVAMLASGSERRRARSWARTVGGPTAHRAMLAFQDESGELAMVRKHLNSYPGRPDEHEWLSREQMLLQKITNHRRAFVPGQ